MRTDFRVNPVILQAAKKADASKAKQIIDNVQTAWDNGESFLSASFADDILSSARESDSEEEVAAAAKLMQDQLSGLALDGAMRAIGKDTVAAMCRALYDADPFAAINVYGIEMSIPEFARRWNAVHPDDKFFPGPAFEA